MTQPEGGQSRREGRSPPRKAGLCPLSHGCHLSPGQAHAMGRPFCLLPGKNVFLRSERATGAHMAASFEPNATLTFPRDSQVTCKPCSRGRPSLSGAEYRVQLPVIMKCREGYNEGILPSAADAPTSKLDVHFLCCILISPRWVLALLKDGIHWQTTR